MPGVADAISQAIDADLAGARRDRRHGQVSRRRRESCKKGRADYLLPTVVHCESPDAAIAKKEYMFPFVTVVECPRGEDDRGDRPDAGVQRDHAATRTFRRRLLDAVHIDRLNLGPVPTTQLNWLQPHEGNIVEFLFRARAFQSAAL